MQKAFTLIELLVVISIIALLIAILLPVIAASKYSAMRTQCASNQRQLSVLVNTFAADNDGVLPRGGRDNYVMPDGKKDYVEHTPFISSELHDYVLDNAGAQANPTRGADGHYDTGTSPIFDCPSFKEGFQDAQVRYQGGNRVGWVIGYQYLGNRPGVELFNRENPIAGSNNGQWRTVTKLSDVGTGEIWADYNNWTLASWVFVAHTGKGALATGGGTKPYGNASLQGLPAQEAGSIGGNVGYIDGSVRWKPIEDMNQHHTYEHNANFPGVW